jgi:putative endonuclease
MSQTQKQQVGSLGEDMVAKLLVRRGFDVIDRNYRKKWGEIDVIAQKDGKIYFIEVKTVRDAVRQATPQRKHPEQNMHPWKLKRLSRAIQTYLLDRRISNTIPWQLDLAMVFLDKEGQKVRIKFMKNIVIGT